MSRLKQNSAQRNEAMHHLRTVGIAVIVAHVLFIPTVITEASEALRVTNDTRGTVELWSYPYTLRQWNQPPERFAPRESKFVYFNKGEEYWLVIKDDRGRQTPVGRHNITQVLAAHPNYELKIRRVVQTAVTEGVRYVWCRRCRQWHARPYGRSRENTGDGWILNWEWRDWRQPPGARDWR